MERRKWIRIITALSILYVVVWTGLALWVSNGTKANNWLIDKEADPFAAPLPNVTEDDWVAQLANPSFVSQAPNARVVIADQYFEKIKNLADEQGYDLKGLQEWYKQTATNAERYPVQVFVFELGMKTNYRDLRNSGFPKPSSFRMFWRAFLSKEATLFAFIGLPFAAGSILLVVGILVAIFSRALPLKWRTLVAVLLIIILGGAWISRKAQREAVSLGFYSFYDVDDYVAVEGTWTSDTKLAAPLQVTKLDCWRQWNHCIEATAQILGSNLSVNTTYWEVNDWKAEEIALKDNNSSLCKVETLRIDRKNKVVTATNTPKQPKPDSCVGLSDDPIVSHLVDGYKLR